MPISEPNDAVAAEAAHEWAVLSRLLDSSHPWTVDEMVHSRENAGRPVWTRSTRSTDYAAKVSCARPTAGCCSRHAQRSIWTGS